MAAEIEDPIPDVVCIDVPVGGRVLVASDLHLGPDPTPAHIAATAELAAAVEAATGPGVLILNGNTFDCGADAAATLAAYPRLAADIIAFANGAARRVIVLPGERDTKLAWSAPCRKALLGVLGAEVALAAELEISTGAGTRRVRVEPGFDLDPLARFEDPRNPRETPFASHIRSEILPAVRQRQGGRQRWLAGLEQLDDPGAFSRFVSSRLVYRNLARWAWLAVIPVVVLFALRVPSIVVNRARTTPLTSRPVLLGAIVAIEAALLAVLAFVALRHTGRALSVLSPESSEDAADRNGPARARARELVVEGHAGLVTAHTCRAELTDLGEGFYANSGCVAEVVTEVPSRLPGLGLPPVFRSQRELAWVEMEAGSELHARLFHGRQDAPGLSVAERLVAEPDVSFKPLELRAEHAASFPHGSSWPPTRAMELRHRRIRRVASLVVVAAGFISMVSAFSEPFRDRLRILSDFFPVVVPETAAALATVGGIALIVLARGIRRGQRRAWAATIGVLLAVGVLHVVKGVDVEEAVIVFAVAAFLLVQRRSFEAKAEVAGLGRSIVTVLAVAVLTIFAGTLGVFFGAPGISWAEAVKASSERMVGFSTVALPHRLDEFFAPAMGAASACLVLALVAVLFRPVVERHHAGATHGAEADGSSGFARARSIVERHASGTLDYFALRPDKQFFFWGDTLVAFAVYGGVCLVSPDPIGPVAEREPAWRAFRRYVDEHGWALGGLGAGEDWLPIYRATGMHDLYVGDEGIVRVGRFGLEGGRFKGLRQAVNRVAKYGYRISFHDPADLDPALRAELEDVMTKSRRGDVERGFSMTLGRAFDQSDRGLLLAVVHGPDPSAAGNGHLGKPVAFCQYVPAPAIHGYSLDLMRRDDGEHPNGLIDFAIVETVKELRMRGAEGLGLNFATMRAVLAGEAGEGVTKRVQAWALRRMGDSMQIESLWRFNAKFDPDWLPRYAVYDAPENMLSVAIAIARAESFWELPLIGRFLVPSASRASQPGTGAA